MTAPHPSRLLVLSRTDQRRRLRVVDYHHVLVELHALPVLLVIRQEDFLRLPGEYVLAAVEGIVKGLCHFEEVVASGDDVPMSVDVQFGQERDQPVQHLGDSSTDRRGIHHLQGLARESASQKTKFFDDGFAHDAPVVVKVRRGRRRWWCLPCPGLGSALRMHRYDVARSRLRCRRADGFGFLFQWLHNVSFAKVSFAGLMSGLLVRSLPARWGPDAPTT